MAYRVAINGYGRIGRNILRAFFDKEDSYDIDIIAINDLAPADINAHLTQYDSIHGIFSQEVTAQHNMLNIGDKKVQLFQEPNPENLPWKDLNIDLVLECSGRFLTKELASKHLHAGAKKVLLSAPSGDADATIVFGVNHHILKSSDLIISNASCTTNCLAPIAKVFHESVGIEQGMMTTIHAYTNDQANHDSFHYDIYRARACALSMIPTKTGAASAVGKVLPELKGKLNGMAVRVPTANVSMVDFHFLATKPTSTEEINHLVKTASDKGSQSVLAYSDKPLVSIDFNHTSASCHFDATQTMVNTYWVKVMAWYDNEWGFANRMLDVANYLNKHI
ncbi:MAG: type I glyceraldehyde-3-phosphate dehydrogenase [Cellvibrionales bacterium]|nr:type I glyceraldehyde-3-phosphate dehydrogenase [Cellvibrionales bacterium]